MLMISSAWAAPLAGPKGKVSTFLRNHVVPSAGVARPAAELSQNPLIRTNDRGEVFLTLRLRAWSDEIRSELEALGVSFGIVASEFFIAECWVTPERIHTIAAHPAVTHIRPVIPPKADAGSRMTEGDSLMRADLVRRLGYDGDGVSVGVVSNGAEGLYSAQLTDDLPQEVIVLDNYDGSEGTAMLEIVHDIAPAARLFFATASPSALTMRNNILALADAGCDVIVDDISYYDEPFFEDGPVAKAIDEVAAEGVVYCTSAGNGVNTHYAGTFMRPDSGSICHAWDAVRDTNLAITVPAGDYVRAFLQWDDPVGASANDYDLFFYAEPELVAALASSVDPQTGSEDPLEMIFYVNETGRDQKIYVAVKLIQGEARNLKFVVWDDVSFEYPVRRGSIVGHSMAEGAVSVGAVNAEDEEHDDIARYSSCGPSPVSYPTPHLRMKPDLVGIDGVSVTGAAGFPSTFYGTSASAPHVAAVAALLMQAHPDWTVSDVRQALTGTARDLGEPGWDGVFGYGLVDAYAALGTAQTDTSEVAGRIATTTWTAFGSPYRVTGQVTIPSGETLTIEPGVDVLFDRDVRFTVEGSLHACGTETDSVRFLRGTATEWGGIRFVGRDTSSLSYVRISDALAEGVRPHYLGGGVYAEGDSTRLSMTHCVVSGNRAEWGGGVYVRDSADVSLENCVIRDNIATDTGGGMRIIFCPDTTRIINCIIEGNRTLVGTGGGIAIRDAAFEMTGCRIADNPSADNAGGCDLLDCDARITGCTVSGNESAASGGAFHISKGVTHIDSTRMSGNSAASFGGAVALDRGETIFSRCLITDNHAETGSGGGIQASGGTFDAMNCTIALNTAPSGGGVAAYAASGILNSSVVIWNTPENLYDESTTVQTAFSLLSDDVDPAFADTAAGNWSPTPGSPLIDTGDPSGPLDNDATRADVGAYAYQNPHAPVWSVRPDLTTGTGEWVSFTVSAVNPLSGGLLYGAECLPGGAAFDLATRTFDWRPSTVQAGEYLCEFSAENDSVTVYKRIAINVTQPVGVEEPEHPTETALLGNVPNPFNPTTTVRFALAETGHVTVSVYDIQGRRVCVLADEPRDAGMHQVQWNGRDHAGRSCASGVYVCRMVTQNRAFVKRMLMVR